MTYKAHSNLEMIFTYSNVNLCSGIFGGVSRLNELYLDMLLACLIQMQNQIRFTRQRLQDRKREKAFEWKSDESLARSEFLLKQDYST